MPEGTGNEGTRRRSVGSSINRDFRQGPTSSDPQSQSIFVNGERLKRSIEPVQGGGGSKYHPLTVDEARGLLDPQVNQLLDFARGVEERLRGRRFVFEVKVLPNYLAGSYYPVELFAAADLVHIGSRSSIGTLRTRSGASREVRTKSMIVAGTNGSIERLVDLVQGRLIGRTAIQASERLRQFDHIGITPINQILSSAAPKIDADGMSLWEAVLHPSPQAYGLNREPLEDELYFKWSSWIAELGGRTEDSFRRSVGGLTFVPIRLEESQAESAAQFNLLRTMRPLPRMEQQPGSLLRRTSSNFAVPPQRQSNSDSVEVAIFDGGVNVESPFFSPFVTAPPIGAKPVRPDCLEHGEAVTGAVLWGNLNPSASLPIPLASVTHYRVEPYPGPNDDFAAYWVLEQIEKVVQEKQPPIVNISLGPLANVTDDDEPHLWTSTLDRLAWEHGTLFVVAAGNIRTAGVPMLARVKVPADIVNGLSVGACDAPQPDSPWHREPYSTIGPGRQGSRVQPRGVQFGGNLAEARPFFGLQGDGTLVRTEGTSMATPLVVHGLVDLANRLGPTRSDLNTLRALAIHLAERHPDGEQLQFEVGHGRFLEDYAHGLSSAPNEALVLFRDTLKRHESIALPVPLPKAITSGVVEIDWTLAITSQTDPTQALEYTMATIEPTFRPHCGKFRFSKQGATARVVDTLEDRDLAATLMGDGFLPSSVPVSASAENRHRDEAELREMGKWETIRRGSVRLRATSLREPQFDFAYLARNGGQLDRSDTDINFTFVVSIRCASTVPLWQMVSTEFPVLTSLAASTARVKV